MPHVAPVFFDQFSRERMQRGNWRASDFSLWTPQQRFNAGVVRDFLAQRMRSIATPTEIAALRSLPNRQTFTTINQRPLFRFLEMIYPGNVFHEIEQKWIYGFQPTGHRCVVEIYAESRDLWRYRLNPTPNTQNNAPRPDLIARDGMVELNTLQDSPTSYGFMLSPFRLSQNGLQHIIGILENATASDDRDSLVRPRWVDQGFAIAALPDPFRWVVDTHQQYYEPALLDWTNWLNNFDRQAERTIAGVLKNWIDTNNDVFGVADNLRRTPNEILNRYNNEERFQRFHTELAGLYLNRWTDQPDHRAVELSAQEKRGNELSATLQMWAITTQNLIASRTGRRLAETLVRPESNRVPRQLIFPSSTETTFQSTFPNMRYAWLAGVAIFDALQPVWLNNFLLRLTRAERTSTATNLRAESYVRRMLPDLPVNNNRNWRSIAQHYANNPSQLRANITIDETAVTQAVDQVYRDYRNSFTRLRFSAAFVVEGFNVYFALNSMWDDLSENRDINILGLSGTSADMSAMIFGYMQRRAEAMAVWNNAARNAGSSAIPTAEHAIEASGRVGTFRALSFATGFAGGVFQCLDEINQSATAQHQGQRWQDIGHSTAAVGAGASAIGAAITYLGSSAWGGWITMAGAALIVGGNLLATALSRNEYEVFAAHCFMGIDYQPTISDPFTPTWAQSELNTRSMRSQLRVLQGILLSFSVRFHNSETYSQIGPNFVQIDFGLLPPHSVLTIELEQCYGSGSRIDHRFNATYVVRIDSIPPESNRVSWTNPNNSNTMISPPDAMRVERNSEKYITKLIFKVTPLTVMANGRSCFFEQFNMRMNCINSFVKVKLRASDVPNPRDSERFLKVDLKEIGSDVISCLDFSRWDPRP